MQLSFLFMGKCCLTNLEVKSFGKKNLSCALQRISLETQKEEKGIFLKKIKNKFMCKDSFSSLLIRYILQLENMRRQCLVT